MVRILVVDDEIEICKIFEDYLTIKGYEVDFCLDGKTAISKVKERKPHIVFLDIKIPGIDGIEVLKEIKRIEPAIEVIMITAVGNDKVAEKTFELGASDFICKPVDFDYLETVVMAKIMDLLG